MAKDRKTISNQVTPIQTSTKTLAFYPNLHPADEYKFGALIDGKIKVWLHDFSNGKAQALTVTHNLDIKDLLFLLTYAKRGGFFPGFNSQKIFGNPVQQGYQFEGLCQVTSINIVRYDKDPQGRPKNYPWTINIENGYGRKLQNNSGGFYMQKNSYVKTKSANISLSDADFLFELIQVENYVNAYKTYVSLHYLPKWLSSYDNFKANGFKSNPYIADQSFYQEPVTQEPDYSQDYSQIQAQTYSEPTGQVTMQEQVQSSPSAETQAPSGTEEVFPNPPAANTGKKMQRKILFDKDEKFFCGKNGVWKIKALTGGKAFWLYFPDRPETEVIRLRTLEEPFAANLILDNQIVWFDSVAA